LKKLIVNIILAIALTHIKNERIYVEEDPGKRKFNKSWRHGNPMQIEQTVLHEGGAAYISQSNAMQNKNKD